MSVGYDRGTVAAALRVLHEPGDVFEVRILKTGRTKTVSGYFNDPDAAADGIAKWDGKAPGVFVTIYPVDPALLARAANRLQPYAESTSSDTNVLSRRWLYVDVDPERPANISASDAEHDQAFALARAIYAHLKAQGWPDPVVADSGNGAHLLYRVDLPNDAAATELVEQCLAALAKRHNRDGIKVDTGVANASRIAKVPGTMACKGDDIPERPHRRSRILSVPERLEVVTVEQLATLAAEAQSKPAKKPKPAHTAHRAEFDVVDFMARHGLAAHDHKQEGSADLWHLKTCPFNSDHLSPDAWILRAADGTLSAGCFHESCFSTWAELREHLEPRERCDAHSSLRNAATLPHPPSPASDEAPEVWQRPVPQPRIAAAPDILEAFAAEIRAAGVVGEDRLAKVTFLALVTRALERPVSVVVKGPSAAGKSFVTEQVLRYFPESAYKSLSGMSEHALVYLDEPLSHRFLVVYEAAGMAGELASYLVRSLLSEGRVEYVTVVKSKAGMVPKKLIIEGPTGLLVTTTSISLHPENETRLLSVPACDTAHQTKAVFYALASEVHADPRPVHEWHQLQLWLVAGPVLVTVPFAERLADLVPPVAVRLRRDFSTVLNLTRAHALLHRASRALDDEGRVVATVADYAAVRELIADLVADEVGATVPTSVQEAVHAVGRLYADHHEKAVSLHALAGALDLDKSPAARRARQAIAGGYLKNLEDKKGKPARYVPGEPLPADLVVLPLPESLEAEAVAPVRECDQTACHTSEHDVEAAQAECGSVAACTERVEQNEALTLPAEDPRLVVLRRAAHVVVDTGAASLSLLQKRLDLYEAEAAQLLELLEVLTIVGPNGGGRARAVLVDHDEADRLVDTLHQTR